MLAAIPDQIIECQANGLNPIFAMEAYYQPDHPTSGFEDMVPEEKKKIKKSYHLLLIALNNIGLTNLIYLSSWSWMHGYYYKPRINKEMLIKHKEGLLATSSCYNSEIGQAFDKYGPEAADEKIKWYKNLFGDNYYLEIMLLDFVKQKPYDKYIFEASQRFNIPTILTNDCHYCLKEDSLYQRYMLMIQKKTTLKDIEKKLKEDDKAEIFELQDQNLWMKSEEELNQKWFESYQDVIPYDFFETSKENTIKICQRAKGIEIDRSPKFPQIEDAFQKLKTIVLDEFVRRQNEFSKKQNGKTMNDYQNRISEELDLIRRKDFSSYFLVQKQIVDEARKKAPEILGYGSGENAVGPGRGSGGGSFINYLLGITDVDPIEFDLLFSRFLNENRGGKTIRTRFTKPPLAS